MGSDKLFKRLISELNLIADQRMAVIYFSNLGDFYSLCTTMEYAEKKLNKEVIVLFYSDRHSDILNWFAYDDYAIKSYQITEEEYFAIEKSDIEDKKKYQNFFIFWECGDNAFRQLTRNVSENFAPCHRAPRFPKVEILKKYSKYIQPNNTVLIMPESKAVHSFPLWFWNVSAKILEFMGFSVVFNVALAKSAQYAGRTMLIPLSEIVPFANQCGFVYGVRSGIFDILSTSNAQMTIFSTSFYKPINEIYHIPNNDNRIKTYFYDEKDPFFTSTEPIGLVHNFFKEIQAPVQELLRRLCSNDSKYSGDIMTAEILKSYTYVRIFNKYQIGRSGTDIAPFVEVKYSADIIDEKYVLSIYDLSTEKYRFDYKVYRNDRLVSDLNDIRSTCLSYPMQQSGEYYIRVTITDKETVNQEYFETNRLFYSVPVPNDIKALRQCNDFYSYILALEKFSSFISVYISSRDSHTSSRESKNTKMLHMLKLLDLETNFANTYRYSYIGVIDGGNVVDEQLSPDKKIQHEYEIDGNKILIESAGYNAAQSDKNPIRIEINGEDIAVNRRGLNIVVWNKSNNELLDSVCFDTFLDGQAYRK